MWRPFGVTGAAVPPAGIKIDGLGFQMSRPLIANAGFRDVPELQADVGDKVLNEAQKALDIAAAKAPGDPHTWYALGLLYRNQSQPKQALEAKVQAVLAAA